MFHSTTAVSNERFLVFGGRTSPLKPCASCQLVKVNRTVGCGYPVSSSGESTRSSNTVERASEAECCSSEGFAYSCEAVPICCADGPDPRWRHTATRITVPPGGDGLLTRTNKTTQPLNQTIPYHTIPYHTVPYRTVPYHTIPCHTIL